MNLFALTLFMGLVIFIQVTLLNFFPVFGVKPDLLLILVVLNAFQKGCREGALAGFLGGLMMDIAVGSYIGMNALVLMAAGYLVGLVESKLYKDSTVIIVVLTLISSLFTQFLTYILLYSMDVSISPGVAMFRVGMPTALYTAVLVPLFCRWFVRSNRESLIYNRRI
ncbi:MAG: rod shape-determining protein MreD [Bacillota bacterium]